jgi:hypothetical protein
MLYFFILNYILSFKTIFSSNLPFRGVSNPQCCSFCSRVSCFALIIPIHSFIISQFPPNCRGFDPNSWQFRSSSPRTPLTTAIDSKRTRRRPAPPIAGPAAPGEEAGGVRYGRCPPLKHPTEPLLRHHLPWNHLEVYGLFYYNFLRSV